MLEQFRSLLVGITLAVLAFLKPIDGELTSLLLVFFLNFVFGYLSGMIANREDFDLKKALRCGGENAAGHEDAQAVPSGSGNEVGERQVGNDGSGEDDNTVTGKQARLIEF